MVEGLEDNRFALISKTHHALIDGISGVDLLTVLFDVEPVPQPAEGDGEEWMPAREPSGAEMVAAGRRGVVRAGIDLAQRARSGATHPGSPPGNGRGAAQGG